MIDLEIIYLAVLGCIFFIGLLNINKKYSQFHQKEMLYLGLLFLTEFIEMTLRIVEMIYDAIVGYWLGWLYLIAKWMLIPRTLLFILLVEYMSRESIRKIWIIYWAALSAIVVLLDILWMILAVSYPLTSLAVIIIDVPGQWAFFLLTLTSLLAITIGIKILLNAPRSLKKQARALFIGFFITGVSLPLFELDRIVPNAPTRTVFGVTLLLGLLLTTLVLIKTPQLAYILPFKVLRLTVLDTESGIAIFTHSWSVEKEYIDEDLFAGMLQGIRTILKESIQRGDLKELRTDLSVLLIEKNPVWPIIFVLVATKSTPFLKSSLNAFAKEFSALFLQSYEPDGNVTEYLKASDLINKFFVFIPD